MQLTKKVFAIRGYKISSLCLSENAILISSQDYNSVDDFMEGWTKKFSLATKVEIKYESIKSIKKEDKDDDIVIKCKILLGLTSDSEFSFLDKNDYETFFNFLEKERYFSKTHETLTPIKAILNYIIGFLFVTFTTFFSYFQALKIADGSVEEAHSSKEVLFNKLIEFLGDKGVLALGTLLVCFLLYKIWTRFSNPPNQIKFLPPNS
jgi:hypothetical protein